jgi:PAS domain S-box-containing protein
MPSLTSDDLPPFATASEERFALAMLGSSDSLWDVDITTNKVYYSPRFKEMFNLGPEWNGDSGQDAIALMHPSDRERLMAEVEAVLTGGHEKLETELRAVTPDGRVLNVLTRAHVARDDLGNPVRMVGTNVDITPLKNAERETRRLLAQLQQAQKMEAIGHLAGGVAHDFNNILASILGFNELAMNGLQSGTAPARLERYLREVESAGFRARDLVQQLLTFSRPDGAAVGNVAVASVVRDSLKMLRATVPSSIAMESSLSDKEAYVCANAVQLHQVMLNLVINARDAMGDTGVISVRMSRIEVAAFTCASCHQVFQGDYITVTVSDTGCGIPAEVRGRIFEPFYTSKEQGKGTGMGLSVVHGILHGFGGHLLLDSEPGKGSAITLFLPPAPEQSPEAVGAIMPTQPLWHAEASILLAEDEDAVAGFMQEALEQAGYKVERARNGAEAWDLFQSEPDRFDMVVTDQAMPLMSGSALAERILKQRPGMPIILVSGYSETVNESTAPAMGIKAFLTKPTPLAALLDAVNAVVLQMRSGETGA